MYLTFERILKTALNRECDLCVRRSAQEEITQYELAQFFSKTSLKVIKMEKKGISGFRDADVCPVNPEIFTETKFEVNEETNEMTNEESEGENDAETFPTTQVNTECGSV